MRERGTQVRRARLAEPGGRPTPPPSPGKGNFWPALAIAAIIVATAGWTVVAVMALNGSGGGTAAVASPTPGETDDEFIDESEEPIEETHEYPDLEALLPTSVDGLDLLVQSWSGGLYGPEDLPEGAVSAAITAAGKTTADLHGAAAADPSYEIDEIVSVYQLAGLDPAALRNAWIEDLQSLFPGFETVAETVGDRSVTRGGEGDDNGTWYAYIADDKLFVIDASDDDRARRLLSALSNGPAGSVPPAAATPASPEASAAAGPT